MTADVIEVDPQLAWNDLVNSVGEVNLITALRDAVFGGRDLDGDARVLCRALAERLVMPNREKRRSRYTTNPTENFFVLATGLYGNSTCKVVGTGDGPDVDIVLALVGDDGLGLGHVHKGTKGED